MRMDGQRVHGLASRVLLPCLDADDRRRLHEGPRPRGYPTTRVSGRRYGMGPGAVWRNRAQNVACWPLRHDLRTIPTRIARMSQRA